MGLTGLGRESVSRAAPLVASIALHVVLIAVAAVIVPRASARILDAIPVELVAVEPPRVVAAVAPPAPAKRVTPPKPIVRPLPKLEPRPTPTAREPNPTPPPAAPAASPAPSAPPAAASTPQASAAPLGPGVSWIDNPAPAPPAGTAPAAVASIPRDTGITRVAQPTGGYQVRPPYPSSARRLGVQGTTMLRVHVLADGRIGDVDVEESAGHRDLDQAAADAVRRWRFEPARRGDEAVAMWVRVPVEFRLR